MRDATANVLGHYEPRVRGSQPNTETIGTRSNFRPLLLAADNRPQCGIISTPRPAVELKGPQFRLLPHPQERIESNTPPNWMAALLARRYSGESPALRSWRRWTSGSRTPTTRPTDCWRSRSTRLIIKTHAPCMEEARTAAPRIKPRRQCTIGGRTVCRGGGADDVWLPLAWMSAEVSFQTQETTEAAFEAASKVAVTEFVTSRGDRI